MLDLWLWDVQWPGWLNDQLATTLNQSPVYSWSCGVELFYSMKASAVCTAAGVKAFMKYIGWLPAVLTTISDRNAATLTFIHMKMSLLNAFKVFVASENIWSLHRQDSSSDSLWLQIFAGLFCEWFTFMFWLSNIWFNVQVLFTSHTTAGCCVLCLCCNKGKNVGQT